MASVRNSEVDSPRSWVVCGASFTALLVIFGIQNSYGVMFVSLLEEFKGSELATAWVGTLSFSLMYFIGPFVTVLCHRYNCRVVTCIGAVIAFLGLMSTSFVTQFSVLFVTYGLLWGTGASMCYFGSVVILNSYFKRRLSLAYGITQAGAGAGVPAVATSFNALIGRFGWRVSLRILAALAAVLFLCGQLFRPLKEETAAKTEQKEADLRVKENNDNCVSKLVKTTRVAHTMKTCFSGQEKRKYSCTREMLLKRLISLTRMFLDVRIFTRNKALSAWTASLCLILSGYFMPFVFLVRMASEVGISTSQGALLVGFQAITQTVFKVVFGLLGDLRPSSRILFVQLAALINAINTTLCPLWRGYSGFVVYVVVFGICDGCFAVMFGMGTHYIVGTKDMPVVFGNVCSVVAIAQALGTPLAGLVYDIYKDYSLAFFISGGLSTLGICVLFLIPVLQHVEESDRTQVTLEEVMDENTKQHEMKSKLATALGSSKKTICDRTCKRTKRKRDCWHLLMRKKYTALPSNTDVPHSQKSNRNCINENGISLPDRSEAETRQFGNNLGSTMSNYIFTKISSHLHQANRHRDCSSVSERQSGPGFDNDSAPSRAYRRVYHDGHMTSVGSTECECKPKGGETPNLYVLEEASMDMDNLVPYIEIGKKEEGSCSGTRQIDDSLRSEEPDNAPLLGEPLDEVPCSHNEPTCFYRTLLDEILTEVCRQTDIHQNNPWVEFDTRTQKELKLARLQSSVRRHFNNKGNKDMETSKISLSSNKMSSRETVV